MKKRTATATPEAPPPAPVDAKAPDNLAALVSQAQGQVQRTLTKIPMFGAVTWLLTQQPSGRQTLLGELEWRVMPPLILEQSKVYLRQGAPAAFVSWARLSDAVAERYRSAPHQLTVSDWNSGPQVWLIDMIAPFGGAQEILKDMREKVFAGQTIHQLVSVAAGKSEVIRWPAVMPPPAEPAGKTGKK